MHEQQIHNDSARPRTMSDGDQRTPEDRLRVYERRIDVLRKGQTGSHRSEEKDYDAGVDKAVKRYDGVVVVDWVLGGVCYEDLVHAEDVTALVGWSCFFVFLVFVCEEGIE